jgi:hypothetical protein
LTNVRSVEPTSFNLPDVCQQMSREMLPVALTLWDIREIVDDQQIIPRKALDV